MSLISKDTMRLAVILQELRTWYASSATNPLHEVFHAPEEFEAFLELAAKGLDAQAPIPLKLTCPNCAANHIDEGVFATKPHHTHACQECGLVWRPAIVPTVGVQFLPGFKDATRTHADSLDESLVKMREIVDLAGKLRMP